MAHPGRARVNAISTALPDSQLRLGGGRGRGRKDGEGGREREREMWSSGEERTGDCMSCDCGWEEGEGRRGGGCRGVGVTEDEASDRKRMEEPQQNMRL